MLEQVIMRLRTLGFLAEQIDIITSSEGEQEKLLYLIERASRQIQNSCNIRAVPKELEYAVIDRVCGEYLALCKTSDTFDSLDLSPDVKSVGEGDTSVTFRDGTKTKEQRLDELIQSLLSSGENELVTYRRLKW